MAPITKENVVRWTQDLKFTTPPENQGQIVLVSYACDADFIYESSYDQSDRSTSVRVYEHPSTDCVWEPWNQVPSTGALVGEVKL